MPFRLHPNLMDQHRTINGALGLLWAHRSPSHLVRSFLSRAPKWTPPQGVLGIRAHLRVPSPPRASPY
ncbi:hypothetical protein MUK42_26730 [Musa troglodytarum]|uniref:Uncharacterized protein n=1 Tax=Musa troglodytarum TaxID=320322 RepID=A0A9E7K6J1_9LILI|nr:hypothetical protein MUK42_26730 [Musa troglodytarum]